MRRRTTAAGAGGSRLSALLALRMKETAGDELRRRYDYSAGDAESMRRAAASAATAAAAAEATAAASRSPKGGSSATSSTTANGTVTASAASGSAAGPPIPPPIQTRDAGKGGGAGGLLDATLVPPPAPFVSSPSFSAGGVTITQQKVRSAALAAGGEDVWVQCDSCSTWRQLPHFVDPKKLPAKWYCSMNDWDSKNNVCVSTSADGAEDGAGGGSGNSSAKKNRRKRGASRSAEDEEDDDEDDEDDGYGTQGGGSGGASGTGDGAAAGVGGAAAGGKGAGVARHVRLSRQRSFCRLWVRRLHCAEGAEAKLPAAHATRGKKRQYISTDIEWIRCCNPSCGKWRAITRSVDGPSLAKRNRKAWYCAMNTWDESQASCDAPQDILWDTPWNLDGVAAARGVAPLQAAATGDADAADAVTAAAAAAAAVASARASSTRLKAPPVSAGVVAATVADPLATNGGVTFSMGRS